MLTYVTGQLHNILSDHILIRSVVNPGCLSRIRIKEFQYFNPKIVFKLSEIWSGLFFPDPDPEFFHMSF